jgi:hypothetical protein
MAWKKREIRRTGTDASEIEPINDIGRAGRLEPFLGFFGSCPSDGDLIPGTESDEAHSVISVVQCLMGMSERPIFD